MAKSHASQPEKALSFEQSLDELEAIVKQLETSELPLDKSLALFERGVKLSEACRKQLTDAETRVEVLLNKGDSVQAQPYEEVDE